MSMFYGYDEVAESKMPFYMLESGRMIKSTYGWNPLVFGLVYGHANVLKFMLTKANQLDLGQYL